MQYKVLFIVPPVIPTHEDSNGTCTRRYPHIGVAYLAAMLKRNGIGYKIIDMNLGYSYKQVLEFVKQFNPDLICVTMYSSGYKKVCSLIEFIKSYIDRPIVIGGSHICIMGKGSLKATQADFAVVGEGEYTLLGLIKELGKSDYSDFEKIKGLIWRQDSEIINNQERPYIQDLDNIPFPAFEDFELEKYLGYVDKRLPIITSRGCPYHCIYCCNRLVMGNRFRARSPGNVVDEIEHWYEKGWAKFDFNDDVFTLDRNRVTEICDLILKRELHIQFNLYVGARADNIDEHALRKLKMAGCRFISYGCQSGNNGILKDIKRGTSVEDVVRAVNTTRKIGIKQAVDLIIGHPTETYEEAMDSIRLGKNLKCNFVKFYNLIPWPRTQLYHWIEGNNGARFLYCPDVYLNDLPYEKPIPVFETDDFRVEQRKKALKKAFNLNDKTLLSFRFGRHKGYFVYLLTRNEWISIISNYVFNLFVSTKIGSAIYRLIVKPPW